MHKPERPDVVNNLELAIQLGAKPNQSTHDLLTYIKQLEAQALQQEAAVAFLQGAIRSGGASASSDRFHVIQTSNLLACGHDERTGRAQ